MPPRGASRPTDLGGVAQPAIALDCQRRAEAPGSWADALRIRRFIVSPRPKSPDDIGAALTAQSCACKRVAA
jgi:hypothetical protein